MPLKLFIQAAAFALWFTTNNSLTQGNEKIADHPFSTDNLRATSWRD